MIVSKPASRRAKRRVHAAVVELDALADAVGAAAEDHDLAAGRWAHLALVLVGRVVVRRVGVELGAAGVDGLERGDHAGRLAAAPHFAGRHAPEVAELRVAEAEPLGPAPRGGGSCPRSRPRSAPHALRRSPGSGRGTTGRPSSWRRAARPRSRGAAPLRDGRRGRAWRSRRAARARRRRVRRRSTRRGRS